MKDFTTEELLEMINQSVLKPVMVMTVKQENFDPYKVPYLSMEEFEEESECIRRGNLPYQTCHLIYG